ncbi:M64 family metallopeptidase [Marinifilum sp. D714]|uniref:M64 family metallopeptidase n=1 Tax=Marinifilum sp. D714 TaxID=2937523 RepID=UPI0027C9AEFE|nr:M64 family metallopeptidase [Marinifilum sp. D714]MDQ2177168.1 M64 family metallopeptidase [Marinifilum sp. D714]
MRKSIIAILFIGFLITISKLSFCQPEIHQHGEVWNIGDFGEDRINIIYMGDGFTKKDLVKGHMYDLAAIACYNRIFSTEPFKTYRNYFNFQVIYLESKDEGIDYGDDGIIKTTVLNCGFGNFGKQRNIGSSSDDKIIFYAEKVLGREKSPKDFIIVGVNDKKYGGFAPWESNVAYYSAAAKTENRDVNALHEFGHAFGLLADEYSFAKRYYSLPEEFYLYKNTESAYNISYHSDPKKVKWSKFIGLPGYEDIGVFEGGHTYEKGLYRPTKQSIMRGFKKTTFNAPSRYQIYNRIHSLMGKACSFEDFLKNDKNNK